MTRIDTSKAEAMEGVLGVITADDFPDPGDASCRPCAG